MNESNNEQLFSNQQNVESNVSNNLVMNDTSANNGEMNNIPVNNNVTNKNTNNKSKKIIIIVIVILVLLVIVGLIIGMKFMNNDKNSAKDNLDNNSLLTLENDENTIAINVGFTSSDVVEKIKNKLNVGDNLEIVYVGIDNENKGQLLASVMVYYNSEGQEVSFDEAIDIVNGQEVLKEGYTSKEYFVGMGKYKANVIDKDSNKEYELIIDIKDSIAPILEVKDVVINEGDDLTINSFIVSCSDNSRQSCEIKYVNDNNELVDIIDVAAGERVIKIVALDKSNNRSDVKEAKLVVNSSSINPNTNSNTSEKPTPSSGNGNSSSGNNGNSGGSGVINSSHPFIKAAQSMVGKTNVSAIDVVEQALKSVNKTLWVKSIGDVRILLESSKGGSYYVGSGEAVCNSTYKDTVIDLGEFDYKKDENHEISKSRKIYVKNQYIYKVLVTTCTDGNCVEKDDNDPFFLNQQYYYCEDKSYISAANIKLMGKEVPLSSIQPGDFLFYENGGTGSNHIAIYIGNNQAIHGGWGSKREVVISGINIGKNASTPTAWRVSY